MSQSFQFNDPDSAIVALAERLRIISDTESVADPIGRILAAPIVADRDSPAADVSAMDGYAIHIADLKPDCDIDVSAESKPGAPPPAMVESIARRASPWARRTAPPIMPAIRSGSEGMMILR